MIEQQTSADILSEVIRTDDNSSFLASLVDTSCDAILSLTLEGKIVTMNRAAEEMFDYSSKEMIGKSVFHLIPLGGGAEVQEKLKRIRCGEKVEHYETKNMKRDGTRFNVSLQMSAIKDTTGRPFAVSWVLRDITAQKQTQNLIRKLSSVVEQTADMVMITDELGKVEYVNPAFEKVTGYSKKEVLGHSSKILKSGKHSRLFYKKLWTTILNGKPFQATITNKKKNGDLFYSEKTITPLMNEEGSIIHFVSTDKDITDRKLAELHLQTIQGRFTALFNFSPDPMAYCALDGTLIETNDAFSTLTGYTKEELVNRKQYQDISEEKYIEEGNKRLKQMLRTRESCTYEKEYKTKEGNSIPVLVTAFPVKNSTEENIVAVGIIVKNISEIKKQQKQIELIDQELKRSNAELDQFASIASHDLQEPLRTLCCYMQLIERKNQNILDKDSQDYLKFAIAASKQLQGLINNLLTYSRLNTNKPSLSIFESKDAVNEACSNLNESISNSNAKIEIDHLPKIYADRRSITQVFQNLISNALKYRSEKPPIIKISTKKYGTEWAFEVSDNGIGIAKNDADRVFEMFQRLHSKEEYPGNGIGLAICKKLVERRGGKIWVESNSGKGSSFFFTVPDELPSA